MLVAVVVVVAAAAAVGGVVGVVAAGPDAAAPGPFTARHTGETRDAGRRGGRTHEN